MTISPKRPLPQVHRVDLKILDEQHRKIQSITNTIDACLADLACGNRDAKEIRDKFHWALNSLFESVLAQFLFEDQLQAVTHYPFLTEHQAEHNKFLDTVVHLLYELTTSAGGVYGKAKCLSAWLDEHLRDWDQHWRDYLAEEADKPSHTPAGSRSTNARGPI